MFLAKNQFTQNMMKKKLEKKGIDVDNMSDADKQGLNFMQRRQLKKYQEASSQIQSAVDTVAGVSETKATYDRQRQAQYDMVKHRNKAGGFRGRRLQKKLESGEAKRNNKITALETELETIKRDENGNIAAGDIIRYQKLQKKKTELEAKNRFQQRWAKQNAKDKKTLRQEARDYRYQEKLDVYNFETRQHDKSEAEIKKEAIKRLKARGKYSPTESEIKQEMKAIKKERKSPPKKETDEK